MQNSEQDLDYFRSPISIDDACSMLRKRVQKNDRPYVTETNKLNNRKVDDWKKTVLQKICNDKGMMPSGKVAKSWELYEEGKVIEKYMEIRKKGMIPDYPKEVIDFWKVFFETLSIEEMHEYGSGVISTGWIILQSYIKSWFAEEKWNRLFSHSSDPLWWEQHHHEHSAYLDGKILPFWDLEQLKDITQKVGVILGNQVGLEK